MFARLVRRRCPKYFASTCDFRIAFHKCVMKSSEYIRTAVPKGSDAARMQNETPLDLVCSSADCPTLHMPASLSARMRALLTTAQITTKLGGLRNFGCVLGPEG